MATERLTGSLQENLLVLMAFSAKSCSLVRSSVDIGLFTSNVYRDIVERTYAYIDQFHEPPGNHLPDLFDDILRNPDHKERQLYEDVLHSAYELSTTINEEYVLSQLGRFVRQQRLKVGVVKAIEALQDDRLEDAEVELERCLKQRLQLFEKGTTLEEGLKLLSTDKDQNEYVLMGIKQLDEKQLVPTRKELHLFMGPPKRGKSWWLARVSKQALLQRWKVLVLTLEMSEERYHGRLLQSLFAVSKRKATNIITEIERDKLGRLLQLHTEERVPSSSFDNEKTFATLKEKLSAMHGRSNLLVKQFPTRSLTMNGLRAHLDALERLDNFIPDIIVLDYADLMHVDAKNYRLDLGTLYEDLRGLAVERNIAIATATQANRAGASAALLTDVHAAEDYRKIATADCTLTYSQTPAEKALGLARIFVANGRNDEDKFAILITQSYATGQFCLDSIRMADSYWQQIQEAARANAISDTANGEA